MSDTDTGNAHIVVEVTDATEFHCFRMILNPQGHEVTCKAATAPAAVCDCEAKGQGARIEIMFHGRSLVDLIHKCSLALCDWQAQTTQHLLELMRNRLGGER